MFYAVFMCFSPYLGIGCEGRGFQTGLVHNLLMHFLQPIQLNNDIVITQNEHPRYVKHVLARIYAFLPYFGCVLLGVDSLRGGLAEGNRVAVVLVFCGAPSRDCSVFTKNTTLTSMQRVLCIKGCSPACRICDALV